MESTSSVLLENVPSVAVEVVIAAEENASTARERDARYSTNYVVMRIYRYLLVCSQIEQTTRRVIRPRSERLVVWKELQRPN